MRRGPGRSRLVWLWAALGFLPAAAGITLAVRQYAAVTVSSAAELSRVGFGWPFAWTVQDQSATFDPVGYPTDVRFIGDRRGMAIEVPPTSVDGALFVADTLIVWGLLVVLVLGSAIAWRWGTRP